MTKVICICLFVLMVLVCSSIAWGCGLDEWSAGYRAAHGVLCEAGPIDAGVPYYNGSTFDGVPYSSLYRHHYAHFNKPADSDKDCHQVGTTFTDVPENSFTCTWTIQKWKDGQWIDKYASLDSDCAGCNWNDTENYEPGYQYRIRVIVNDTPWDSPHGEDAQVTHFSAGVYLNAPSMTNFRVESGPTCTGGTLDYYYTWDSDCGHRAHLDKSTIRENVVYGNHGYTSNGLHDKTHGGTTCWIGTQIDPDHELGGGAYGTGMTDTHSPFTIAGDLKASYCAAAQVYEVATGWPNAPPTSGSLADTYVWTPQANYDIHRFVENEGSDWQYRVNKNCNNGVCTQSLNTRTMSTMNKENIK